MMRCRRELRCCARLVAAPVWRGGTLCCIEARGACLKGLRMSHPHPHHDHPHHDSGTVHSHTHGSVDPTIVTTQRGLWAVKWSFIGLCATALMQGVIVWLSGRVALLGGLVAK